MLLRDRKVAALHQRQEIDPPVPQVPPKPNLPSALFSATGTTPSLEDTDRLVGPASWPTLTAQSFQSVAAEAALLRECRSTNSFELA
eukprot:6128000-Lingulodinium_polyedra.AAC.1